MDTDTTILVNWFYEVAPGRGRTRGETNMRRMTLTVTYDDPIEDPQALCDEVVATLARDTRAFVTATVLRDGGFTQAHAEKDGRR
jgi:hypothetical protein